MPFTGGYNTLQGSTIFTPILRKNQSTNSVSGIFVKDGPIFVFLDRGQVGNYTPALYQSLADAYKKHAKPYDYLNYFNNVANSINTGYTYLGSTMTTTISYINFGSTYNSNVDANGDVATLITKSYKIQFYDYEPGNTPRDQMPMGQPSCTVLDNNGTGSNTTTFGTANWTGNTSTMVTGNVYVVEVTGLTPGQIFNRVGLNINTSAGNIRVKVYRDDGGGGNPSTLLAESNSIASPGTGIQYFTLTSNPTVSASGNVWVGLENDNGTLVLVSKTAQASGTLKSVAHAYGAGPSPFGAVTNGTAPFYAEVNSFQLGTGSSSTAATTFFSGITAPLIMGAAPAAISGSNITNLAANSTVYVIQAQALINGAPAALLASWNTTTALILSGNPNAKIIAQMSKTLSSVAQMEAGWDTLRTANRPPDGLTIFYSTTSGTEAQDITDMDTVYQYAQNNFF